VSHFGNILVANVNLGRIIIDLFDNRSVRQCILEISGIDTMRRLQQRERMVAAVTARAILILNFIATILKK